MYMSYESKNLILPFIFNCMTLLSPGLISFFASHIYFPSLALLVCKNSKVPFLKKFTLGSYKKSLYSSIESPKIKNKKICYSIIALNVQSNIP